MFEKTKKVISDLKETRGPWALSDVWKNNDVWKNIDKEIEEAEIEIEKLKEQLKENLDYKMVFEARKYGEFNESSLLESLHKITKENESLKKQLEENSNDKIVNTIREKLAKILNESPLDIRVATFLSNILYQMEHKQ
jgi:hypothetical protein